jgi:spore maturation protein CgeB
MAQGRCAVFLTTDRDFFHTIPHLHESHCGIIVIALKKPNRAAIMEKLLWILDRLKPSDFTNRVIQLRDRAWIAIPPINLAD